MQSGSAILSTDVGKQKIFSDLTGINGILLIFQVCNWLFYSYGTFLDLGRVHRTMQSIVSFLSVATSSHFEYGYLEVNRGGGGGRGSFHTEASLSVKCNRR